MEEGGAQSCMSKSEKDCPAEDTAHQMLTLPRKLRHLCSQRPYREGLGFPRTEGEVLRPTAPTSLGTPLGYSGTVGTLDTSRAMPPRCHCPVGSSELSPSPHLRLAVLTRVPRDLLQDQA